MEVLLPPPASHYLLLNVFLASLTIATIIHVEGHRQTVQSEREIRYGPGPCSCYYICIKEFQPAQYFINLARIFGGVGRSNEFGNDLLLYPFACLCVSVSVTRRYCIETAARIGVVFFVFLDLCYTVF